MRIVFVAACVAIAASAVVVEQSPMQFPEMNNEGSNLLQRSLVFGNMSIVQIKRHLEHDFTHKLQNANVLHSEVYNL